MKAYEALITLNPTMKKEDMDVLIQEVESDISKNQGKVAEMQRIGRRKLEHPIRKQAEGYFVLVHFHAEPQAIKKLTEKFRLREMILRFFFVDRQEGFVKFKSFDENAAYSDHYAQEMPGGQGGI